MALPPRPRPPIGRRDGARCGMPSRLDTMTGGGKPVSVFWTPPAPLLPLPFQVCAPPRSRRQSPPGSGGAAVVAADGVDDDEAAEVAQLAAAAVAAVACGGGGGTAGGGGSSAGVTEGAAAGQGAGGVPVGRAPVAVLASGRGRAAVAAASGRAAIRCLSGCPSGRRAATSAGSATPSAATAHHRLQRYQRLTQLAMMPQHRLYCMPAASSQRGVPPKPPRTFYHFRHQDVFMSIVFYSCLSFCTFNTFRSTAAFSFVW